MTNRAQPGRLRRELRFSKSLVDSKLAELDLSRDQVRPLLEALMSPDGLLGLHGSELLLLEKILDLKATNSAVRLVGELVNQKFVPADTSISYGYLSKTNKPTNLGLVGLGFSDGLPRSATNQFTISIGGRIFRGVGRIAMDQCVIDLANHEHEIGSEATFFGPDYPLKAFTRDTGFTELEILGRITSRVTRVWSE